MECRRNTITRIPDWLRATFGLDSSEVPTRVLVPDVMPVLNIAESAGHVRDGALAFTALTQLPNQPCSSCVVQASAGNPEDVRIGTQGTPNLVLAPGSSFSADVGNLDLLWVAPETGLPCVVRWFIGRPGA
jgi:hypothetical protein